MLKVIITGYKGRLGSSIHRLINTCDDAAVVAGVDLVHGDSENFPTYQDITDCVVEADCIIDCSRADGVPGIVRYAAGRGMPIVVCTTGLSDDTKDLIKELSATVPIFCSANMSLGINLMCALSEKLVKVLASAGFDVEIVERHHNQKLDAPSGTALMLADSINAAADNAYTYVYDRSGRRAVRGGKELGIHAVRGGTITGEHEVIFAGADEVLEIRHSAASKEVFAIGALKAARYIVTKGSGLYDMRNLIEEA
jgi:4-hydroxy-tetrahydrodipicolinate reductase